MVALDQPDLAGRAVPTLIVSHVDEMSLEQQQRLMSLNDRGDGELQVISTASAALRRRRAECLSERLTSQRPAARFNESLVALEPLRGSPGAAASVNS
jgi:hypothetical protein